MTGVPRLQCAHHMERGQYVLETMGQCGTVARVSQDTLATLSAEYCPDAECQWVDRMAIMLVSLQNILIHMQLSLQNHKRKRDYLLNI